MERFFRRLHKGNLDCLSIFFAAVMGGLSGNFQLLNKWRQLKHKSTSIPLWKKGESSRYAEKREKTGGSGKEGLLCFIHLVQPLVEGLTRDAQHPGGNSLIVSGLLQGFNDKESRGLLDGGKPVH